MISDYPASTPNEYQQIPNMSTIHQTEIQPTVLEIPIIHRGIVFLNYLSYKFLVKTLIM